MTQLLYPVYPNSWPFVMESRVVESVSPEEVDGYWADGWRHFGSDFFRSSLMEEEVGMEQQCNICIGTFLVGYMDVSLGGVPIL